MLPHPFDQIGSEARSTRKFDCATTIARNGDAATAMFFVSSGRADLLRYSEQGEEIVIHRAGAGETICEAALFSDMYHCDVIASADSALVVISKKAVLERLRLDAEFALAVCGRFAGQIQDYRKRLEISAIRDARARVFAAMVEGLHSGDIKSFAALIGLSHEATYRALAELSRSGKLVKTGRASYVIAGNG